ncbi:sodium:calcium antiporter [uncultured Massilia sp.]|uniref:sodium:calcium antiporter n=1 Tax=uncultured Massilia sp. TaxID=169973 RepID=UPI00258308F1|nr:sodium:calcium antiporter [uncultured Massilia sp.]
MNGMAGAWIQFLTCMAVIGYAGGKLARYGDIIGAKTGWSGNLAGLLLLSTVTSLPELATGISAAGFAGKPDLAAGDVFGSCVFNLLILAFLDALRRKEPLYGSVSQNHILSAAFGVGLLALAGAALVLGKRLDGVAFWQVGIVSPLLVVLYVLSMRAIDLQEKRHGDEEQDQAGEGDVAMSPAILIYAIAAAVVVAAGGYLPFVATRLAELMGWESSFVGTLFVAAATSMPELSVAMTALRIGRVDMALGSILGSNMFNMVMLAVDDAAYRQGPLLSAVSPVHAVSVFVALAMSGLVIGALVTRTRTRVLGTMSWYSIGALVLFGLNSYAQHRFGAG